MKCDHAAYNEPDPPATWALHIDLGRTKDTLYLCDKCAQTEREMNLYNGQLFPIAAAPPLQREGKRPPKYHEEVRRLLSTGGRFSSRQVAERKGWDHQKAVSALRYLKDLGEVISWREGRQYIYRMKEQ